MTIAEALAVPDPTGPFPIRLPGDRIELAQYLADAGLNRGVEIGTLRGEYADVLCKFNPSLRLTCIDPWIKYDGYHDQLESVQAKLPEIYMEAVRRLSPYPGCELWRMTSEQGASLIPDGSLDFVFIDGNHTFPYVVQDLELWTPKIRPGGLLTGHDYHHFRRPPYRAIKVVEAVNHFVSVHAIEPWWAMREGTYFWRKR